MARQLGKFAYTVGGAGVVIIRLVEGSYFAIGGVPREKLFNLGSIRPIAFWRVPEWARTSPIENDVTSEGRITRPLLSSKAEVPLSQQWQW